MSKIVFEKSVQTNAGEELTNKIPSMAAEIDSSEIPELENNPGMTFDPLQLLEYGSSGLNRWGGNVGEEFLPQLKWPHAAKVYKEMSDNDPVIGAVMYMIEQITRKATWSVEPASKSKIDLEAAEFLEQCMNDMSCSWADTISEILSYFIYGWSYHEIVYKYRRGPKERDPRLRSKYSDNRIGWRKIPIRSQHTLYGWLFDTDGGIKAMQQQAAPDYKVRTIPLKKGLLFRTKIARDNPEGRSLLRNAYRPWYFKKRIEEIEGIGIERDLAGLPTLIPPEGVDLWNPNDPNAKIMAAKAESIVRNVRRDRQEGIVIPNGWDFKLVNTGGSRQFDTNAIINRYDQRIAITLLADIVMMGGDKVGSFALAEVKQSLLSSSLEAQTQNICDIFNKYAVPKLFNFNDFGVEEYPKIRCSEIEAPSLKDLGDYFRNTGMKLDDDYELYSFLRQVASMPEVSKDDFERMKREHQESRVQTQNASAGRATSAEQNKDAGMTGNPGMDAKISSGEEDSK